MQSNPWGLLQMAEIPGVRQSSKLTQKSAFWARLSSGQLLIFSHSMGKSLGCSRWLLAFDTGKATRGRT